MKKIIVFETERLHARQWCAADREAFAVMSADPKAMEFYPQLLDREASDAMANRCEALIAERGWGLWAIELKATRSFIGFVGLHIPSITLPFTPCVEIGWRLALAHWGQGYATEAAREALRIGFETLTLPEIVSFTAIQNVRSCAVMLRLGMQDDAFTFEHPSVPEGHPHRVHCLYRLTRAQWESNR